MLTAHIMTVFVKWSFSFSTKKHYSIIDLMDVEEWWAFRRVVGIVRSL